MTVELEFFRGFKSNLVFALLAAMISSSLLELWGLKKMELDLAFFVFQASCALSREGSH